MTYGEMKIGKIYKGRNGTLSMVLATAKVGKCIVLMIADHPFINVPATYSQIDAKEIDDSRSKQECIAAIFQVAETYATLLQAIWRWDEHI